MRSMQDDWWAHIQDTGNKEDLSYGNVNVGRVDHAKDGKSKCYW